jgi:hypothetical protein
MIYDITEILLKIALNTINQQRGGHNRCDYLMVIKHTST